MAVTVYLEPVKGEQEEGAVMFSINHIKPRIRLSAQLRIKPAQWNPEKSRAKQSYTGAASFNRILTARQQEIEDAILKLMAQGKEVNKKNLESLLEWKSGFVPAATATLQQLQDKFIADRRGDTREITLKNYQATFNVLADFARHRGKPINIHTFNVEAYRELKDYYTQVRKRTNNAFDAIANRLKAFINWCKEKGYTDNQGFKDAIKRTATVKEINPLLPAELHIIEAATTKFSGLMNDVRCMFLFQCYTGLRFGDVQALSRSAVKGDAIHLTTNKTTQQLKIPLLQRAKAILSRYEGAGSSKVFPRITNQAYNRYLKDIFSGLDLTRIVEERHTHGKEITVTQSKLCDVVTSHDGRRTFITLSLSQGMNAWQLMTITGHENYETFKKYVRFSDQEIQNRFLDVWAEI